MPAADDDISMGELGRRINRLEGAVERGFSGVHRRIDELAYVEHGVYEADKQTVQIQIVELAKDIKELQEANKQRAQEAAANRRLTITAFAAPLIVGVAVAVIVAAILGSGG